MSIGGGDQTQELQQQLEALEEERQTVEAEIQQLRTQKAEADEAIEALSTLEQGSTVQVPLGGGAFVRAEVHDLDEVIVGLGGGFAAERDEDGAVDALEHKKDTLDERIEDLHEEMREIESESEQLEQRARQVQQQQLQQQMQQQMQQQGQQGQGPGQDQDDE